MLNICLIPQKNDKYLMKMGVELAKVQIFINT